MGGGGDEYENEYNTNYYEDDNTGFNNESQIDVIETPFSRQRQPRKVLPSGTQNQRAQSHQRPLTGNADGHDPFYQGPGGQLPSPIDRIGSFPVNAGAAQQQSFTLAQQQRPNTGNMGKPPKHHQNQQHHNDYNIHGSVGGGDDNILDLLGESKDRGSVKGSQSAHGGKPFGSIDDDESEDEDQQDEEEDHGGDD